MGPDLGSATEASKELKTPRKVCPQDPASHPPSLPLGRKKTLCTGSSNPSGVRTERQGVKGRPDRQPPDCGAHHCGPEFPAATINPNEQKSLFVCKNKNTLSEVAQ